VKLLLLIDGLELVISELGSLLVSEEDELELVVSELGSLLGSDKLELVDSELGSLLGSDELELVVSELGSLLGSDELVLDDVKLEVVVLEELLDSDPKTSVCPTETFSAVSVSPIVNVTGV